MWCSIKAWWLWWTRTCQADVYDMSFWLVGALAIPVFFNKFREGNDTSIALAPAHAKSNRFCTTFSDSVRTSHITEPRHDSGRAYCQSDVRRLVPFAIGQTCWGGHRNIRCPQCRQIQPSSSPGQDLGFDTYKDYEQEFLALCAKQEALFLLLDILHWFVLEWGRAGVASDGAIFVIYYLERRSRVNYQVYIRVCASISIRHQIFRFAKMILRDGCSTSYDLASLFRGRRSTLRHGNYLFKKKKRIGTKPVVWIRHV